MNDLARLIETEQRLDRQLAAARTEAARVAAEARTAAAGLAAAADTELEEATRRLAARVAAEREETLRRIAESSEREAAALNAIADDQVAALAAYVVTRVLEGNEP